MNVFFGTFILLDILTPADDTVMSWKLYKVFLFEVELLVLSNFLSTLKRGS